ncbi:RidA family protein [Streptomyces sp. B-S-A8]|uniref:RidA family protein n=1 Tax=Streptomyces solicavernae TaxID=3043614 RepID=A0ABT6RSB7_9ACTN|nr:RidA family protein [Streptomyces sp. B-S-A8]MDI3387335.1 RidA family protein [Streptomyces sp. B-S-A8]
MIRSAVPAGTSAGIQEAATAIRRTVVPTLFAPPRYTHASVVEAGTRLAFLAGSMPLDAAGVLVGPGDHVAQARQVIANLEEQLKAVGSELPLVAYTDVYVVADGPGPLSEVWQVVEESGLATGASGPHSSTLIGVSTLGCPGQLVEITATAVVPED